MVASSTREIEPGIVERLCDGICFVYVESRGMTMFMTLVKMLAEERQAVLVRDIYGIGEGHHEFPDLARCNVMEYVGEGGIRIVYVQMPAGKITEAWRAM